MKTDCQIDRLRIHPLSLAFVVLLLTLVASSVLTAEQLVVEYNFDPPQIETVTIDGQSYDRIIMNKAPSGGDIGMPSLPAAGATILLPPGSDIESIDIEYGDRVLIGDGYFVEPVARPVRLSSAGGSAAAPVPDPSVYGSSQPFPGERFQNLGIQQFRGFQILTVKLQPVDFTPTTGELFYYPRLTVMVNTIDGNGQAALYRGIDDDYRQVVRKVDNPAVADLYSSASSSRAGSYDLLIVTTPALAASFQPLKDYHDTTGILTEIHTTTAVGSSAPEDVRDYIRDRYLADGIEYVIIGADDDIMPAPDLYVKSWEGQDAEIELEMPGDIYFACLDGTYNYDGDSDWGEPTDGDYGGDVDLVAEVSVGRASVGNTVEADRFVAKTIQYLTSGGAYLDKVLMVGEYLGFGGVSDYAKPQMEQNVDGSSADGYTTIGIPSDEFEVEGLYEQDYTWPQSDLTGRINAGLHILNHLGHGSPDYAMKLYDSDVLSQLTNTDHCFIYSQTCLAGHFDGTDCWAEHINLLTDAGAFAVIMNARYGWGSSNSTDGPNQRFNREFWDAIFNPGEGISSLGQANHDSKEDNLYRVNESCMRWCYYEINLFGDPTITLRQSRDIAFSYPSGIPEIVSPGQTTPFTVVVEGVGSGVPVAGSGQLHYTINGGSVQSDAMTITGLNRYEATLPAVSCGDELLFYVSADELVNGIKYDPDPSAPHSVIVTNGITSVFEDDFQTDQGWTVSGNVGDGPWDRGLPIGGGERGDPATDFDGSGSCYLTDNEYGNSDVDDGTTTLTSPTIDLSEVGDALIHYARWYSNNFGDDPNNDVMNIYISNNNGNTWTLVETVGPIQQANGGWFEHSFYVSEFVLPTDQIVMRFDASDLGSGSVVEAALDDFTVTVYSCGSVPPAIITTSLPDWTAGVFYSRQLEASGGTGALTWVDKNGDLVGTGLSLSSDGLLSGTTATGGLIAFVAEVTDEMSAGSEQALAVLINPAVAVVTTSLPEWTAGIPYSVQLTATGGGGALTWSDRFNDLVTTGLVLAPNGNLSGSAVAAGTINFTAQVVDTVGSADQKILTITVNPAVAITVEPLPEGTEGEPYSVTLAATGGTGTLAFSDKNGDLAAWGLTLDSEGILNGTPSDTGLLTFTVRAEDDCGCFAEQEFSFRVAPAYICGDVDNSDSGPDISDITYLVAYMFGGGPPPPIREAADMDADGEIAINDLTFLVSYLFSGGPSPEC